MKAAVLNLIYGTVGLAVGAGAIVTLAIWAARETRNIEGDRDPIAGHAATDVGVEP